jgi:hypothetical protein
MSLILIGVLLAIGGVVLSALRMLRSGRLSQDQDSGTGEQRDTLEPRGQGRRLDLQVDLPGIGLFVLGVILIFAGAA